MCCGDIHSHNCLGARLNLVFLNLVTLVLSIMVLMSCEYITFEPDDENNDDYYGYRRSRNLDEFLEGEWGGGVFAMKIAGECYSYNDQFLQLFIELAADEDESSESFPDGWTKMAQAGGIAACVALFLGLIGVLLVLLVLEGTASRVIWVSTRYLWKIALAGSLMTIGAISMYVSACTEWGCWPGAAGYMAAANIIVLTVVEAMSSCLPVLEEPVIGKCRHSNGGSGADAVPEAHPNADQPKADGHIIQESEESHHTTENSTEAPEDHFPVIFTSANVVEIDDDPANLNG